MVDARSKVDLRRLEWIVGREVYGEEEDTSRIWAITGSHDSRLPVKEIIADRSC